MIDYHPTDADADMVVDYIIDTVNNYIERISPKSYPDFIVEYLKKHNTPSIKFKDCCSIISIEEMLADLDKESTESFCSLDDILIHPSKNEDKTLEDYLHILSEKILNDIESAGFINYWLNDLQEYDRPSLARLMIKVNIRLLNVIRASGFYIRDELISRVYYHLHDKAFKP